MYLLNSIEANPDSRLLLNIIGAGVFIVCFIFLTGANSASRWINLNYTRQFIYQLVLLIFIYLLSLSSRYLGLLGFLIFIVQFSMICKSKEAKEAFTMFQPEIAQSPAVAGKSNLFQPEIAQSPAVEGESPIFGVLDKSPITSLFEEELLDSDGKPSSEQLPPILSEDDVFKLDPVKKSEILRAVRAQLDFDPYKSDLTRETILDIYRKYFGEDEALRFRKDYDTAQSYQP